MRRLIAAVLVLFMTGARASQGSGSEPSILVEPRALATRLEQTVLVDARSNDDYERGHIPGAISVPWIELARMPESTLVRAPSEIAGLLMTRGIPSDQEVVVYGPGSPGNGEEGRVYWTLVYVGHRKVRVLNGGWPAWRRLKLPRTTEGPKVPSGRFKLNLQPSVRVTKEELVKRAPSSIDLIDVREPDEFLGAQKFGEARGGHIPGALNIPWRSFLDSEGLVLKPERVRAVLNAHGVAGDRRIVVYCTGGIRSGFAFLALRSAGVTDVANYDGSFWEWASDPRLPVESAPH